MKKMAVCAFYQDSLRASSKATEKKMLRKTPKDIKLLAKQRK